jgi:DNA polymerase delta subunit 1
MERVGKKIKSVPYARKPVVPFDSLKFINTHIENYGERIFLYGVTEHGNSVCVKVANFKPYFYVLKTEDIDINYLEQVLAQNVKKNEDHDNYIYTMEVVTRTSIMEYQPNGPSHMYKITMNSPAYISTCRDIFVSKNIPTYEANILFVMRFMIDKSFGGFDWIKCDKFEISYDKETNCQIEADMSQYDFKIDKEDHNVGDHVRILIFDLEILKKGAGYAGPEVDPVIIISCVLCDALYNIIDSRLFVFVPPGKNANVPHVNVELFEQEQDMFIAFKNYILDADPDIFSGYNIDGYDWPYLFNRAKALGVILEFSTFGRLVDHNCYVRNNFFQSAAKGVRKDFKAIVPGRFSSDMLKFVKEPGNRIKLRSYKLGNVLAHLLGKNKVDMPYDQIPKYYHGTEEQLSHLCTYAWYDSESCRELLINRMVMVNYVEKARVCGVPMEYIIYKGMEELSMSVLLREAQKEAVVVPTSTAKENDEETAGATVKEPIRGLHEEWVITLDLQSLYPSIIMSENICYSTIVPLTWAKKYLKPSQYKIPPGVGADYAFVTEDVKIGLINKIEQELFNWRLRVKAQMKNEKDPHKYSILDSIQNSIKLLMNSLYGFFKGNKVCDKRCMEAVTAWGRQILKDITKLVEETFKGCQVIYGDTDSIFVKFFGVTKEEAFKLGQEAADLCTHFLNRERKEQGKPYIHKLQREKGFNPFFLDGKKRYAGKKYMSPTDEPIFSCSGMENVRRDNALIGSETQEKCLEMIIMQGDLKAEKATVFVQEQIRLLLAGKIEMSKLIITKGLSQTFEHYEKSGSTQAHVVLANKINARKHVTGELGYATGDRVKYVIVCGAKGAKIADCAEDPMYALQHRLNIDYEYYIWNQMMKPLLRVFTPILSPGIRLNTLKGWKDAEKEDLKKTNKKGKRVDKNEKAIQTLTSYKTLFTGSHMMGRIQKSSNDHGILKFATKKESCLGCKTSIDSGILCSYCEPKRQAVYLKMQHERNILEKKQWACWVTCQDCVGDKHAQKIECANNDCSNFYEREKVIYDIEDLDKKFNKF